MKENRLIDATTKSRLVTVAAEAPQNASGMVPIGTKVLVLTDEIDEKTKGGVFIPEKSKEQNEFAICTGTLVAVGEVAFTDWPHRNEKWPGKSPQQGDRVWIAKFCGFIIEGKDGRRYRLCQDTDVCGMEV